MAESAPPNPSSPVHLYRLQAMDRADREAGRRATPATRIREQLARGFVLLRFERALETDFCHYLRVSGRFSRATLAVVAFLAVAAIPFLDAAWFGLPQAAILWSRVLQFGFMLPLVGAIGVYTWCRPQARAVEPLMVLLFFGVVAGLLAQRVIDTRYGYDLPVELVAAAVVGMFALARIRFWIMVGAAALATAAMVALEVWLISADPYAYYHLYAAGIMVVLAVCSGYSSEYFIRWTWLTGVMLRYVSRLDSLTGLFNRNALEEALDNARAHAYRSDENYSIAMIDIDVFGAYNDHYGHQVGDQALRRVADVLKVHARRPQDVCGRYGGEEFVLLWMGGEVEQNRAMAESLREVIEAERIEHRVSPVAPWVTVSIGVCHVDSEHNDVRLDRVLRAADRALYDAKEGGRNRIVCVRYETSVMAAGEDRIAKMRGVRMHAASGDNHPCGMAH